MERSMSLTVMLTWSSMHDLLWKRFSVDGLQLPATEHDGGLAMDGKPT